MIKSKRVRRSEATWRELFAKHRTSGLSVREFCQRERISAGVFWQRRAVLKDLGTAAVACKSVSAPETAPFIDIGEIRPSPSRFEVRLELGGGIVLSVARS